MLIKISEQKTQIKTNCEQTPTGNYVTMKLTKAIHLNRKPF